MVVSIQGCFQPGSCPAVEAAPGSSTAAVAQSSEDESRGRGTCPRRARGAARRGQRRGRPRPFARSARPYRERCARPDSKKLLTSLCVSAGLPGGGGSRQGSVIWKGSAGGAGGSEGTAGPGAAMRTHRAPAPARPFAAPRAVTPSTRQRHPARCPSRRARSQGRRASPDPPEPGPYPRAGKRCPH